MNYEKVLLRLYLDIISSKSSEVALNFAIGKAYGYIYALHDTSIMDDDDYCYYNSWIKTLTAVCEGDN